MGDSQGIFIWEKQAAETGLNTQASTMGCRPHIHSFYSRMYFHPEALNEQCHLKIKSLRSSVF